MIGRSARIGTARGREGWSPLGRENPRTDCLPSIRRRVGAGRVHAGDTSPLPPASRAHISQLRSSVKNTLLYWHELEVLFDSRCDDVECRGCGFKRCESLSSIPASHRGDVWRFYETIKICSFNFFGSELLGMLRALKIPMTPGDTST